MVLTHFTMWKAGWGDKKKLMKNSFMRNKAKWNQKENDGISIQVFPNKIERHSDVGVIDVGNNYYMSENGVDDFMYFKYVTGESLNAVDSVKCQVTHSMIEER